MKYIAVLLLLMPAVAYGQWGSRGCSVAGSQLWTPSAVQYVQPIRVNDGWVQDSREPRVFHYFKGGKQRGSFRYEHDSNSFGAWMAIVNDKWQPAVLCHKDQIPLVREDVSGDVPPERNYGLIQNMIENRAKITLNRADGTQKDIDPRYAQELVESGKTDQMFGDPNIPDDSKKLRITVIGSEAERKQAASEWEQQDADFKNKFIVWYLPPGDHSLCDSETGQPMWKQDGRPTIYCQTPDGRVINRQDDSKDWISAIRRASKKYDSSRDPDNRRPFPLPNPLSPSVSVHPLVPLVVIIGSVVALFVVVLISRSRP